MDEIKNRMKARRNKIGIKTKREKMKAKMVKKIDNNAEMNKNTIKTVKNKNKIKNHDEDKKVIYWLLHTGCQKHPACSPTNFFHKVLQHYHSLSTSNNRQSSL